MGYCLVHVVSSASQGSVENARYNVTGCAIYSTHERFHFHHGRIRSSSSSDTMMMMSSCTLGSRVNFGCFCGW